MIIVLLLGVMGCNRQRVRLLAWLVQKGERLHIAVVLVVGVVVAVLGRCLEGHEVLRRLCELPAVVVMVLWLLGLVHCPLCRVIHVVEECVYRVSLVFREQSHFRCSRF